MDDDNSRDQGVNDLGVESGEQEVIVTPFHVPFSPLDL